MKASLSTCLYLERTQETDVHRRSKDSYYPHIYLTSENSLIAAEWASVRAQVQSYHFTVEDIENQKGELR